VPRGVPRRQASLQKRISAQQRSHFFRQLNGLWQVGQTLVGKSAFLTPRMVPLVRVLLAGANGTLGFHRLFRRGFGSRAFEMS